MTNKGTIPPSDRAKAVDVDRSTHKAHPTMAELLAGQTAAEVHASLPRAYDTTEPHLLARGTLLALLDELEAAGQIDTLEGLRTVQEHISALGDWQSIGLLREAAVFGLGHVLADLRAWAKHWHAILVSESLAQVLRELARVERGDLASIERVAALIPLRFSRESEHDCAAYAELRRRAEDAGITLAEAKRRELITAVVLALGGRGRPQAFRHGRQWLTDATGRQVEAPPEEFPITVFWRWLVSTTCVYVRESLAGQGANEIELPDDGTIEDTTLGLDPLHFLLDDTAATEAAREILTLLSPMERHVVVLLDAGYEVSEIASALNIGVQTVYTHRRRAREKLARRLA
jgi:DNA-binding CsgD family transcriptional regulator